MEQRTINYANMLEAYVSIQFWKSQNWEVQTVINKGTVSVTYVRRRNN